MKTVHLVFNAHLDPIWLWPWAAGLDAARAGSPASGTDPHPVNPVQSKKMSWRIDQGVK